MTEMSFSSIRKHRHFKKWKARFDLDAFVRTGELPADTPPLLSELLLELASSYDQHYARQLLTSEQTYAALQSQINPHFLYNTLEAIRSEALLCDKVEIADMTERLARFFRYSISSRGDFVTLQDELNNLRDYFAIQKFRFSDRFKLNIVHDDAAVLRSYLPKMTLQPLVENAIYHGLEPIGHGSVNIRFHLTEQTLTIWITDDGAGMSEALIKELSQRLMSNERRHSNGGMALVNVNTRIRLYFGDSYGLRISSLENAGTEVELRLPFFDDLSFSRSRLENLRATDRDEGITPTLIDTP